mmetsp:Transcript_1224/g.2667  ORF Transcript_1224/g.2667 Transcript_1224/m.2667 type:complete len:87 (-) Transcript_1224:60-320(-)
MHLLGEAKISLKTPKIDATEIKRNGAEVRDREVRKRESPDFFLRHKFSLPRRLVANQADKESRAVATNHREPKFPAEAFSQIKHVQ